MSPVKWNSEFLESFFAFLNFWLCFLWSIFDFVFVQFLTVLFFFADFPFGWIVDLTFIATKWWTTFFVKEHRSTKLKQLESIFCWTSWQISSGLTLFSRFSCCESMDCDRAPYNIEDLKKAITSNFEQSKTSVTVKIIQLPQHSNQKNFVVPVKKKNWTSTENYADTNYQNKIYCSSSSEVDSPWQECQIKYVNFERQQIK